MNRVLISIGNINIYWYSVLILLGLIIGYILVKIEAKRKNIDQKFLDNYRLATVLKNYEIENDHPHKSISDAMATLNLALKLIKNDKLRI